MDRQEPSPQRYNSPSPAQAGRVYRPLDPERDEIRLMSIEETSDRSIRCKLAPYGVSICPPYAALSYTWGSPADQQTILVNNDVFSIRRNLYDAFRAILDLRNKSKSGRGRDQCVDEYFWVDSICIDQDNIAERNHQVGLMKNIFARATWVLVWLGQPTDNSSIAFHTINNGNLEYRGVQNLASETRRQAVLSLLRREYWSRIWIIQEIVVARDIVLLWGEDTLLWKALERFVSDTWFSYADKMECPALQIIYERQHRLLGGRATLRDLVSQFHRQKCTDIRDRVFALLGLVSDGEIIINVDYSLSAMQLYKITVDSMDPPRRSRWRSRRSRPTRTTEFEDTLRVALELQHVSGESIGSLLSASKRPPVVLQNGNELLEQKTSKRNEIWARFWRRTVLDGA